MVAGGEQQHGDTGAMASKQGPLHTSRSWPHSATHSPRCTLQLLLAWWVLGTPQSLRAPCHFPLFGAHTDPSAQTPAVPMTGLHPQQHHLWMRKTRVSTNVGAISTPKKPGMCLQCMHCFYTPCHLISHACH